MPEQACLMQTNQKKFKVEVSLSSVLRSTNFSWCEVLGSMSLTDPTRGLSGASACMIAWHVQIDKQQREPCIYYS